MKQYEWDQAIRLHKWGFYYGDYAKLVSISRGLRKTFEHFCNGVYQRAEDNSLVEYGIKEGDVYTTWEVVTGSDRRCHLKVRDREAMLKKQLDRIMGPYKSLAYYIQGDPRGTALYIYQKRKLPKGQDIHAWYSSIGVGVS